MDERGAESIRPAHPLPRNSKRTDAENDMRCAHGSRPLLEEPARPSVGFQVGFIRRLADSCSQSRKPSGRRIDLEGRWKRFHWVRLEPKDDPSPPLSDMKGRLPAVCIPLGCNLNLDPHRDLGQAWFEQMGLAPVGDS